MQKRKGSDKHVPERAQTTKPSATKKKTTGEPAVTVPFPIVGIGASAGGMEAVIELLEHLSPDLGLAYVVIQHLAPDHESNLVRVLERHTGMPVHSVENGMQIEKNNIYVIPPGTYMRVADGALFLAPRKHPEGGNFAIDHFLISLANACQDSAIGIILSGTATDGTAGLEAIKAAGGITFAQNETARFSGMPSHAAEAGYVDFVRSPKEIANELAVLVRHTYAVAPPEEGVIENNSELRKIQIILHTQKGVDFSHYKPTTIHRRILRRMALNRLKQLRDYTKLLRENGKEVDLLYQDLLINVTCFFREPAVFQMLARKIYPELLKGRKSNEPVRIWVPACATGEEACSIAISLYEYLGDNVIHTPIQIFGTDLNEVAIDKARAGIYPKSALLNVSPQRLERFFVKLDGHYQVIKPIRDLCIFATHNLLKDPPFSKIDLISCQNVLIYLEASAQKKIMQAFHYGIKPNGFLLLGKSETIGNATELFSQVDKQHKIYSRKAISPHLQMDFPFHPAGGHTDAVEEQTPANTGQHTEIDIDKETDKLLLSRYVPASVVVNKDLQILRFHGDTSKYLQPSYGKASLHLLKMVREELVFELRSLTYKVRKEGRPFIKEGLHCHINGQPLEISLEVVPVKANAREPYYLILFREKTAEAPGDKMPGHVQGSRQDAKDQRIAALEEELREAREHMKSMSEEFEATREELQSANEEVLSSNEELQSINEELETSKEELQSTNEELTTINEELQHRNDDLKELSDYLEAIVETISEPLMVLNADLRVRTANRAFYQVFKGTPDDTEGNYFYETGKGQWDIPLLRRQLSDMVSGNRAFQNLEITHEFSSGEKTLLVSATRMGQENNKKDKILLSFVDITQRKIFENELREREERFHLMIQNAFDIVSIFSRDGTVQYQSGGVEYVLGYKPEEILNRNILNFIHPEDVPVKAALLNETLNNPGKKIRGEFRLLHRNGSYRIMEAVNINLLEDPRVKGIVVNYRDVTERRMLEKQKEEFIGIASHELRTPVTSIKAYAQLLQDQLEENNDKPAAELVRKMDKQIDRLAGLIKDLLDVTKLSEGRLPLHKSLFDLNELIQEAIEEVQRTTSRHHLVRELNPLPQVQADRDRIRQVLVNLLSNAIKYSPEADKVVVSTKTDASFVTVCVQDFGIGITESAQQQLFTRFYRVNDPAIETFPGLGLGLYIAAEIVKRHGGRIWVHSKKGEGSAFYFTLPL